MPLNNGTRMKAGENRISSKGFYKQMGLAKPINVVAIHAYEWRKFHNWGATTDKALFQAPV